MHGVTLDEIQNITNNSVGRVSGCDTSYLATRINSRCDLSRADSSLGTVTYRDA